MTTTAEFVRKLRILTATPNHAVRSLFSTNESLHVARAPGRLDVIGGIADYSGSLVLEMPIAEAAFAAVQFSPERNVVVASAPSQSIEEVRSAVIPDEFRRVEIPAVEWRTLIDSDYESARRALHEYPPTSWAAYVLGPILVLLRETGARLDGGLRILIDSDVPEGKGVSSSAAIEVATMRAAASLIGRELSGEELGRLCQIAENRVVGAPCGIMDQMTSSIGRENQLLALRCQPAIVEGYAAIPRGVAFWGIDSGIRHAVSGSDYGSVRTGAFMGYRIIAEAAGLQATPAGDGRVTIDDPRWHGYLANLTPDDFNIFFVNAVPREISGREFLDHYTGITDTVTHVDPDRTYAVSTPTFHPIGENFRVHRFHDLLHQPVTDATLREMGELMYAANASYSACGLASDGTDLLVEMVRDRGPASGLYGAKITGGGSGGTVAILGRSDADPLIDDLARNYTRRSGRDAYIFRGSSPGAASTDVVQVTL